jgi:hypothetical protein
VATSIQNNALSNTVGEPDYYDARYYSPDAYAPSPDYYDYDPSQYFTEAPPAAPPSAPPLRRQTAGKKKGLLAKLVSRIKRWLGSLGESEEGRRRRAGAGAASSHPYYTPFASARTGHDHEHHHHHDHATHTDQVHLTDYEA